MTDSEQPGQQLTHEKRHFLVSVAAHSDIGLQRKANEDSYYVSPEEDLIIVCDGMGGQVAGGFASRIAVETVKDVYYGATRSHLQRILQDLEINLADSAARLVAAVRVTNRRLYTIAAKFPKLRGMGTTVVALAIDEEMATMVHVGDSRICRISGDKILQLTEDHSWLNELIEDNEINEEQIETFQEKNIITRALGTSPSVKLDIHCEKYRKNDIYVLSTDGLHNSVRSNDMHRLYKKRFTTADSFAKLLIEKAKRRDGSDNITVAVVKMERDCKESSQIGISTTIEAEDSKTTQRQDKFIQDHYGDPKLTLMKKNDMPDVKQNRLLLPAVVLLTGVVCFLLGMFLQNANSGNVGLRKSARVSQSVPGKQVAAPAIRRSKIKQDAVLAFVFFNSMEDYRRAMLDERADVLDRIQPYTNRNAKMRGNFSLFLIDDDNNVIRKIAGLQLPRLDAALTN